MTALRNEAEATFPTLQALTALEVATQSRVRFERPGGEVFDLRDAYLAARLWVRWYQSKNGGDVSPFAASPSVDRPKSADPSPDRGRGTRPLR